MLNASSFLLTVHLLVCKSPRGKLVPGVGLDLVDRKPTLGILACKAFVWASLAPATRIFCATLSWTILSTAVYPVSIPSGDSEKSSYCPEVLLQFSEVTATQNPTRSAGASPALRQEANLLLSLRVPEVLIASPRPAFWLARHLLAGQAWHQPKESSVRPFPGLSYRPLCTQ
jgi:hypothetical protein